MAASHHTILPFLTKTNRDVDNDYGAQFARGELRAGQVLLPVAQEHPEPEGCGGRRQGAAVRRRVRPEQHADDAAAAEEEDAASGGATAAGGDEAGGAAAVAGVRAGQAGEAQVLQRGALQRHHGPDQDGQGRQAQQGMHLHQLRCHRRFLLLILAIDTHDYTAAAALLI
jgi:hypothetical protein